MKKVKYRVIEFDYELSGLPADNRITYEIEKKVSPFLFNRWKPLRFDDGRKMVFSKMKDVDHCIKHDYQKVKRVIKPNLSGV